MSKRLRITVSGNSLFTVEDVRGVVQFTCPAGVTGFDVQVTDCESGFKGVAYARGSSYHENAKPFVNLRVSSRDRYPRKPVAARNDGYLPLPYFASPLECLVYLCAHELRHLWQAKVPRGRRVWGSRGQFSERDACAYGIRKLREWRRGEW